MTGNIVVHVCRCVPGEASTPKQAQNSALGLRTGMFASQRSPSLVRFCMTVS